MDEVNSFSKLHFWKNKLDSLISTLILTVEKKILYVSSKTAEKNFQRKINQNKLLYRLGYGLKIQKLQNICDR